MDEAIADAVEIAHRVNFSERNVAAEDSPPSEALRRPTRRRTPPPPAPQPADSAPGVLGPVASAGDRSAATRAGMALARARGVHLGRPPAPVRGRVAELAAAGWSLRRIAAELGVSVSTVRRAIADRS